MQYPLTFLSSSKPRLKTMLVYCSALLLALFPSVAAFNFNVRNQKYPLANLKCGVDAGGFYRQRADSAPMLVLATGISPTKGQTKPGYPSPSPLDPKDAWIANLDYEDFGREVADLGKELLDETGEADVQHLHKIVAWRNIAALLGLCTVWATPNPLTIAALSTWTYASWTMIAHHTCHGGYNRVDVGKRFHSRDFGLGLVNRFIDWLDWMQPEAWNAEHNRLHHYRLNESRDPDLVERNLGFLRDADVPLPFKYVAVALFLPIWKWFYYAPNTYKELKTSEWVKSGRELPEGYDPQAAVTVASMLDPSRSGIRKVVKPSELFFDVLGPMFFGRYVAIPSTIALLVPSVGTSVAIHAVTNLLLAELLTNVHSFITIVTNHAGEDVYAFDDAVRPRTGSFYVRQVIGSVNCVAGSDTVDFMHGFLNYQIEHHVWPNLSMLQYQRGAPRLKAICERHGVPYIQENVFERLRKTFDIMVGQTTMRAFPTEYEPEKDKAGDRGQRRLGKRTNCADNSSQ